MAGEYPKKRYLDHAFFMAERGEDSELLSYTDLTVKERRDVLSNCPVWGLLSVAGELSSVIAVLKTLVGGRDFGDEVDRERLAAAVCKIGDSVREIADVLSIRRAEEGDGGFEFEERGE